MLIRVERLEDVSYAYSILPAGLRPAGAGVDNIFILVILSLWLTTINSMRPGIWKR